MAEDDPELERALMRVLKARNKEEGARESERKPTDDKLRKLMIGILDALPKPAEMQRADTEEKPEKPRGGQMESEEIQQVLKSLIPLVTELAKATADLLEYTASPAQMTRDGILQTRARASVIREDAEKVRQQIDKIVSPQKT